MNIENDFINSVIRRLQTYKSLADKAFEQLDAKDVFLKASEESNSIAVIVQHLHGNLLSRFTNFLTEDGEKPWRKRDEEFEDASSTKEEVLKLWKASWDCVSGVLHDLKKEDLVKIIYIRSEPLTVSDALMRMLSHYAYHVGQIVFIAKMVKDKSWNSLSIPKGESRKFNEKLKQL